MGLFDDFGKVQLKLGEYKKIIRTYLSDLCDEHKLFTEVEAEIIADWHRTAQKDISRKVLRRVGWSNTTDDSIAPAQVILVDGATKEGLSKVSPLYLDGVEFRPYKIPKGIRSEHSYFISTQRFLVDRCGLVSGLESNEQKTRTLLNLDFDENGILIDPPEYTPKVCIGYCNIERKDKSILVLRPQKYLSDLAYGVYCGAVLHIMGGQGRNRVEKFSEYIRDMWISDQQLHDEDFKTVLINPDVPERSNVTHVTSVLYKGFQGYPG